jgi:hypothetical protein
VNARSHLLCRARGVTVRCIALALSAASVGCASSSNREDHRVENAAPDHHYRASDSQLNAASDRYTGGDLDRYEHSDDIWTKSQDRVLNARSPDQPHQHDAILSRPDQALQATNFSPLTDGPETPKRAPDSKEMLAINHCSLRVRGRPQRAPNSERWGGRYSGTSARGLRKASRQSARRRQQQVQRVLWRALSRIERVTSVDHR